MTVHDVIVMTYREAAILAVGVMCSWIAIYLWAIRDRDNDRTTLWMGIAFAVGFACGWFAHAMYVSGALW